MNNYFKNQWIFIRIHKGLTSAWPIIFSDFISMNIWLSLNATMKMITEHAFLSHRCKHSYNIKCGTLYEWQELCKTIDIKKEKQEKIMAGITLKTQLWYLLVTHHRQKNHGGYFYFLHMQLNGHWHLSRKHTVHSKCPYHIAVEARGTKQGHYWQGGQIKWCLSALSRVCLCPGERSCNLRMLNDEWKMAAFSQELSNNVPNLHYLKGLASIPNM